MTQYRKKWKAPTSSRNPHQFSARWFRPRWSLISWITLPPRNFVCICMYVYIYILYLVGGFNHLEIYESRWEGLSHILWKILVNVPDHQPDIYIYIYYDICFLVKWGIPKPHSGFLKWFQTRSFNTQMDFRTWLGSFEEPAWIQFCFMPFTSSSTPTWHRAGKSPLWSSESGVQGANERFYLLYLGHFLWVKNPIFLSRFL